MQKSPPIVWSLPPNSHTLFFGHSFMGQLVVAALCAHETQVLDAIDHRNLSTVENRSQWSRGNGIPDHAIEESVRRMNLPHTV